MRSLSVIILLGLYEILPSVVYTAPLFPRVIPNHPQRGDDEKQQHPTNRTKEEFAIFLKRYGHLHPKWKSNSSNNDIEFKKAVKNIQRYGGLKETGLLDNKTIALLHKPRCGLMDSVGTRKKRNIFLGSKWSENLLYYHFQSYTSKMMPSEQKMAFDFAFKLWSAVIPLVFVQTYKSSLAKIEILFATGDHGDGYPFDGPGNTLAHTFGPTEGNMHFDDDEDWNLGSYSGGINLYQVAAHEAGHAVGLGHSPDPSSIMNPFYPGYKPDVHLAQSDIDSAQSAYGIPTNYVPLNQNNQESTTTTTTYQSSITSTTTLSPSSSTTTTTTTTTTEDEQTSINLTTEAMNIQLSRFTPPMLSRRNTPLQPTITNMQAR